MSHRVEAGRIYLLQNVSSLTFIDLSGNDGISVTGWQGNGGGNQQWRLLQSDVSGKWVLKNMRLGKYISIPRATEPSPGTRVIGSDFEGDEWDITPFAAIPGAFIISLPEQELRLTLADNGNPQNGTPVELSREGGGPSEASSWLFLPVY